MQIKDEDLIKFIEIYEKEFGKKPSREEAYNMFLRLATVVKAMLSAQNKPEDQPKK